MESLLWLVGRHLEEQDRNTFQKILKLAHGSLEMERKKKVLWVCEKKSNMMTWALQEKYSGRRGDTSIHLMPMKSESVSRSVVSDSLQPHGRQPTRFLSHGILQARILERVATFSPGDLPGPGIKPGSPALQAHSLPSEPPGKPQQTPKSIPALLCRDSAFKPCSPSPLVIHW